MNFPVLRALFVTGIFLLSSAFAFLNPLRDKAQSGNNLQTLKQYDQAIAVYQEGLGESSKSPELHYDLANALYRKGDFQKAIGEYSEALGQTQDEKLKTKILANLGNANFQASAYDQAIENYIKALRLDPSDRDLKANLELARKKLRENAKNQKNQQSQQSKTKAGNAGRTHEQGERRPTEGGDPFDNQHGDRSPSSQTTTQDNKRTPKPSDKRTDEEAAKQAKNNQNQNDQKGKPMATERMSKEEAQQLLQALEEQQKTSKKKIQPEQKSGPASRGQDW
jgi:tetratricopeptide (TPR) repeat protein